MHTEAQSIPKKTVQFSEDTKAETYNPAQHMTTTLPDAFSGVVVEKNVHEFPTTQTPGSQVSPISCFIQTQ